MNRNIFEILDAAIEEIEANNYLDTQDVVLLPPCDDPFASDEEEGDDDIGLAGNINLPTDVSGTVELQTKDSNVDSDSDDNNEQPQAKGNKRNWRDGTRVFDVNWYQNDEICNVVEDFPQLVDNSELELYKLFFDDEAEQLFLDFSKKYATTQKKRSYIHN